MHQDANPLQFDAFGQQVRRQQQPNGTRIVGAQRRRAGTKRLQHIGASPVAVRGLHTRSGDGDDSRVGAHGLPERANRVGLPREHHHPDAGLGARQRTDGVCARRRVRVYARRHDLPERSDGTKMISKQRGRFLRHVIHGRFEFRKRELCRIIADDPLPQRCVRRPAPRGECIRERRTALCPTPKRGIERGKTRAPCHRQRDADERRGRGPIDRGERRR